MFSFSECIERASKRVVAAFRVNCKKIKLFLEIFKVINFIIKLNLKLIQLCLNLIIVYVVADY